MVAVFHAVDNARYNPFVGKCGKPLRKLWHMRLTRQAYPLRYSLSPALGTRLFYLWHLLLTGIANTMQGIVEKLRATVVAGIPARKQSFSNFRNNFFYFHWYKEQAYKTFNAYLYAPFLFSFALFSFVLHQTIGANHSYRKQRYPQRKI